MEIERSFYITEVRLPPVLESLDSDGFWDYKEWQDTRGELSLISKFKGSLNADASKRFPNGKPPKKPTENEIKYGSVTFGIKSKTKSKRPRYGEIHHEFRDDLIKLKESYDSGTLKKGYRTIKVESGKLAIYISLDMPFDKLKNYVKTMLSEKEDAEHKIEWVKPDDLFKSTPEVVTVVSGTDYEAWTEYNARMFQEARNLKNQGDTNTGFSRKKEARGRFKKILLEDSFRRLGEKPKVYVKVPYPFGDITFVHKIEPNTDISYDSIIKAFLNPLPKDLEKGGKVGDFIIAKSLLTSGLPERLKEKGIWDEKFEQAYRPVVIKDKGVYVLLSGILKRLDYHKKESTSTSYDQHVSVKRTR
jgi:hypothetical protein